MDETADEFDSCNHRMRTNAYYTSYKQKEYLVEFMSRNLTFATNARQKNYKAPPGTRRKREALWHKLAAELNTLPGPHKTVAQWKKYWIDARIYAKDRYRREKIRAEKGQLNGKKYVTDLDKRILEIDGARSTRKRKLDAIKVNIRKLRSRAKNPSSHLEKTVQNQKEKSIGEGSNISETITVLDVGEDECQEEQSFLNSKQHSEIPDEISQQANSAQKPAQRRTYRTIYKKIKDEIVYLKSTLVKELFQFKNEKVEIERQKMQQEAERIQLEKEKFALEKRSIAERLKIESQKAEALVSISNAINLVAEKSAMFSVTEDLEEESEAEI